MRVEADKVSCTKCGDKQVYDMITQRCFDAQPADEIKREGREYVVKAQFATPV